MIAIDIVVVALLATLIIFTTVFVVFLVKTAIEYARERDWYYFFGTGIGIICITGLYTLVIWMIIETAF
jgi:hypothetical protein